MSRVFGNNVSQAETADDGDRAHWRGATYTGNSSTEARLSLPEGGLDPVWMTREPIPSGNSGGWSSPIVSSSFVYLFVHEKYRRETGDLNYREIVFCWDRHDGSLVWRVDRSSSQMRFPQSGTPMLVGDRLLLMGANRTAFCLDASNGDLLWECELVGEQDRMHFQSSFAEANGIAAIYLDRLIGIQLETGDVAWEADSGPLAVGQSSPIVWMDGDRAKFVCNTGDARTICVDAISGELEWTIDSQASASTCLIVDGRLIVYGANRRAGVAAYQLGEQPPTELWRTQQFGDSGSSPTVVGDNLFVQGGRELACLDHATGEVRWSQRLDLQRPRYTSLVSTVNQVVYGYDGLLIIDGHEDGYRATVEAKILGDGWMGTIDEAKQRLNIDQLEGTSSGRREAQRIWQTQVEMAGPLPCCTPTLEGRFLFIRLRDRLACYDLGSEDH